MPIGMPAYLPAITWKQGSDLAIPLTFVDAGVGRYFTRCSAQLFVRDGCNETQILSSTSQSPYGSIWLADQTFARITLNRILTQGVLKPRQDLDLYITFATGERRCVLTALLLVVPGAPY